MSPAAPTVGVFALQGDVREHVHVLEALGAQTRLVRRPADLEGLDGAGARALVGSVTGRRPGAEEADALRDELAGAPWLGLLEPAKATGEEAGAAALEGLDEELELVPTDALPDA